MNATDLQASVTAQSMALTEGGLLQLPGRVDEWALHMLWGRREETSHRLITYGITERRVFRACGSQRDNRIIEAERETYSNQATTRKRGGQI